MAFGTKTNEREGTRAVLRNAPGSASKVRVVLDLIRGLDVQSAREVLEFCERDAATTVGKLLDSAIANAEHNDELVGEELFVSACFADEARTQKRFKPRARGRAGKIFKRTTHITVIVSRLPEDRLARLKAKAEAAQTERRARRGSAATPERGRRARVAASQKADAVPTADDHEGHDHEAMIEAVVENEVPVIVDEVPELEDAAPAIEAEAHAEAIEEPADAEASAPAEEAAPTEESTETDATPEAPESPEATE